MYVYACTESYSIGYLNFPSFNQNESLINMSEIQPKGQKSTEKCKLHKL